jgi:hypothetical protein
VVALVDFVEVDEVGIRLLGPGPRGLVDLVREDADGSRDGDALEVEEAELVLPVEAGRRDTRIGQPVQRDVVEDLVAREVADGLLLDEARWMSSRLQASWSIIQAARAIGESASPYSVWGRFPISSA